MSPEAANNPRKRSLRRTPLNARGNGVRHYIEDNRKQSGQIGYLTARTITDRSRRVFAIRISESQHFIRAHAECTASRD